MSAGLLACHLGATVGAMLAFWIAVVAGIRHGTPSAGAVRVMARLAYTAAGAGGAWLAVGLLHPGSLAALAPRPDAGAAGHVAWLASYGLVLVVAAAQHAIGVQAAGPSPVRVRSVVHLFLNTVAILGAVLVLPAALAWREWWFLLCVPLGFGLGLRNLLYAGRPSRSRAEWSRERLVSMMVAGAVLHGAAVTALALLRG